MKRRKHAAERVETHMQGEVMIEHLHRYALAIELCKGKTVLDIASGEGYGSNLLAGVAKQVVGVDISAETIAAATQKYASGKNNLQFKEGRAEKIPLEDARFDVVVSFETIEHHDKHQEMMEEIRRVLKPGGLLIISSPDKYFYSEKPGTPNPYHVKELYKKEFEDLLKANFGQVELYRQKAFFSSVILPDSPGQVNGEVALYEGDYSEIKRNNEIEPVYLLALASDNALPRLGVSLYKDYGFVSYMRRVFESTTRYKFGNMVLNPVQFFKQKFSGKKK